MDGQFSDDFKAQYRGWYGHHFDKREPDYNRCAEHVYDRYGTHQCERKNGHGPHGAWCRQHDPVAIQAKREAAAAKRDAENRAWMEKRAKEQAVARAAAALEPALRQIAEGHNDSRGLAESVLAALDAARATRTQPTE